MDGNTPVSLDDVRFSATEPQARASLSLRRVLRSDVMLLAFDALAVWDILAVVAAGYGSVVLRDFLFGYYRSGISAGFQLTLASAVLASAVMRGRPSRAAFDALAAPGLAFALCQRFVLWAPLTLGAGFLTGNVRVLPRFWLASWIVASFALLLAGRLGLVALLRAATARGLLRDRVAVVGAGPAAELLFRQFRAARRRGVELAYVADLTAGDPDSLARAVDDIVELGRGGGLDRVVMALPDTPGTPIRDALLRLKALDVEVSHCPSVPWLSTGAHATEVGGAPLLVLAGRPLQHGGRIFKSAFDRVAALLGILFLSPVLLLAALAVQIDSPGPVIFRQNRHGWNNTPFSVFKFRTMRAVSDAAPAPARLVQTRRNDERVTRVGRILRTTSLDELPQLFNVLNGTMSLVGPRPHPVLMRTEDRLGEEIIAEYSHRHRVKPGITGWAQIHGFRGATETAEQVRSRVEHDLFYIDNWSFALDLKILLLTPFRIVFQRHNAF